MPMRAPPLWPAVASLGAAALIVLAFRPFSLWPLALVALVPLCRALDRVRRPMGHFLTGFVFGAVLSAALGYWVLLSLAGPYEKSWTVAGLFFLGGLVVPHGLLFGLFGAAYGFLRRPGLAFYALVFPALWVVTEILKEVLPFLLPWAHLGYAVAPASLFGQIADLGGVYGVSFAVVLVNGLVACLTARRPLHRPDRHDRRQRAVAGVLLAVALAGPFGYGAWKVGRVDAAVAERLDAGQGVSAVIVQGNFSQTDRWSGLGFSNRLAAYLSESRCPNPNRPCVVVWPETVVNVPSRIDDRLFAAVARAVGPEGVAFFGGLRKPQGADHPTNALYFVSGRGRGGAYDKNILLPWAETPLGVDVLGTYYAAPAEFAAGTTPPVVRTPLGPVGTSICLEILYPGYVRQAAAAGAGFLVNVSNDAWFGDTSMPWLHLDAARVRAMENRRFVLRASNSGISAIIDPVGRITAGSRLFERDRVTGPFVRLESRTLYTRAGDWIVGLCLVVVAGAFVWPWVRPRRADNGQGA